MAPQFDLEGIKTREIGRLMEVLAASDVEECEIEQGDHRLALRRRVREEAQHDRTEAPAAALEEPGDAAVILAPAVGTFRRSDKASSPPRVEIGSRVKAGDVVGYIEVMRVPHSVLSTEEGFVDGFLAEDGQPVEFGQPLISLQPSAFSHQP